MRTSIAVRPTQAAVADLAGTVVDIRWTVEQVVLVADRSSPHGPRLVDLVGVPLASTQSACRRADP